MSKEIYYKTTLENYYFFFILIFEYFIPQIRLLLSRIVIKFYKFYVRKNFLSNRRDESMISKFDFSFRKRKFHSNFPWLDQKRSWNYPSANFRKRLIFSGSIGRRKHAWKSNECRHFDRDTISIAYIVSIYHRPTRAAARAMKRNVLVAFPRVIARLQHSSQRPFLTTLNFGRSTGCQSSVFR